MIVCKECGSDNLIKKGCTIDGRKRHKCKNCGSQAFPINIEDSNDIILAKQKQKLQDEKRISKKIIRNDARIENAFEVYIKNLIDVLKTKEFTPIKRHNYLNNPTAMIVQISDTHFNELVDLDNNKYDFNIASKRLFKFAERIRKFVKLNNIKNIYLVLTGDLINSDRRTDELLSMATNRTNATILAVELLQKFIDDLNSVANISVISVSGNESRVRDEYSSHKLLITDNYDCMIYQILQKLYTKSNSVRFISGDNDEFVLKINGVTFLITHGNNLSNMASNNISNIMSRYNQRGVIINYVLCGHLHETKINDILLRSGSLVGANTYSDRTLNLSSKASQNIHIVYENGDVDSIRIDLQNVSLINNEYMYDIDEKLIEYDVKSYSIKKNDCFIYEVKN